MQDYLIVRVKDAFEAQRLIDYFPRSYRSKDDVGMTVVIPCSQPLAYGQEAAGIMGGQVTAYGMKADGTKFRLQPRPEPVAA